MTEFTDTSTVSRLEKVKRLLRHIADGKDMTYFFNDGYPREKILQNDARAALETIEAFWPPKSQQRREEMAQAFEQIANIFRTAPPETGLD